jgi:hypothetical protein
LTGANTLLRELQKESDLKGFKAIAQRAPAAGHGLARKSSLLPGFAAFLAYPTFLRSQPDNT